jgi:hypothetical protein
MIPQRQSADLRRNAAFELTAFGRMLFNLLSGFKAKLG